MEATNVSVSYWLQNEADCLEMLERDWEKIPLYNCNDLQYMQDNKLARFRGMVQDMFNPEYYFEKFEVVNERTTEVELRNGKYQDSAECKDTECINFESSKNITSERHTFVLISPPGLNEWAELVELQKYKLPQHKETSLKVSKRSLEVDEAETSNEQKEVTETTLKKQCTSSEQPKPVTILSQEYLLNFPLPDRKGKACHLKLYTKPEELKLNELIEVVGFLSIDPLLNQIEGEEGDGESTMEIQTHNPPASLIPRLHCVKFKKLVNFNPYSEVATTLNGDNAIYIRKELHIALTQLLLGDELASEYLIYHLLSKVYNRGDLLALGKFSLNISEIPALTIPDYGKQVYVFLEKFLLKSHYLPMTLENMNDLSFIPKKDYECNRITSGILQLSENTHLILDETKLSTGRLNEAGVKAVGALFTLIKNQKTVYDFSYYQMEFNCDVPCLVLSEGKSLLPSDVHVPLITDISPEQFSDICSALEVYLKPELLELIRRYICTVRHSAYDISEDIQQLVENSFVEMRQKDNATVDELHNLMVLARLVCLSEGKSVLDETCWKRACHLEHERKARVSALRR